MKATFWRWAHQRYHAKRMTILVEAAVFNWGLFWLLAYVGALYDGWQPDIPQMLFGMALPGPLLLVGYAHRRIRLEANKGPDALYRKRLVAEAEARSRRSSSA